MARHELALEGAQRELRERALSHARKWRVERERELEQREAHADELPIPEAEKSRARTGQLLARDPI